MTVARLLHQTVTIQTVTDSAVDRYGVPTDAVTDTTEVEARLEQTDSTEVTIGEQTIISDWRVFLPKDTAITHRDQIVDAYGRTFEVVGAPNLLETPRGPHHMAVRLRFVE